MSIILKYIGDGSFLPGVPDRDLSEEDVVATGMEAEELVKTGLWAKADLDKPSNKADLKGYQNKVKS